MRFIRLVQLVLIALTARSVTATLTCEQCGTSNANNVWRVKFYSSSRDGIEASCVEGPCVEENHLNINTDPYIDYTAVRCYKGDQCPRLQEFDERLVVEGWYDYRDDDCQLMPTCEDCLTASDRCDLMSEMVNGAQYTGCRRKGFITPSETFSVIDYCRSMFQCGDCPEGWLWRVEYTPCQVWAICFEPWRCTPQKTLMRSRLCLDNTQCDQLEDPAYMKSGGYPYPEDSCYYKDCTACKQAVDDAGENRCVYLTDGTDSRCFPIGSDAQDKYQEVDSCNVCSKHGKTGRSTIGDFVASTD